MDFVGIVGVGKAIRLFGVFPFPFSLFPFPLSIHSFDGRASGGWKEGKREKTLALVRLTDPFGLIYLTYFTRDVLDLQQRGERIW